MKITEKIKQINREIKTITRPVRDMVAKFLLDKKHKKNKVLNLNELKTVLFLRNDNKIGDMVVSTILFREIKKKYPKIKIIVLSGKDNKEIIKHNLYVDEIVEAKEKDLSTYFRLRKYKIDLVVDTLSFDPRPLYLLKLRIVNPVFLIGYDKQHYNTYDFSIQSDNETHITKKYEKLLNYFQIYNPSFQYDIFLGNTKYDTNTDINDVKVINKIVINPFGASIHRSLASNKLQDLINKINKKMDCNIFVLCQKNNYDSVKNLRDINILNVSSPLETAYIISKCDFVISPDTSVVHIARVFNKKLLVLCLDYSNQDEKVDKIWAPAYDNASQIFIDTKHGKLENDLVNIDNDVIVDTLVEKMGL